MNLSTALELFAHARKSMLDAQDGLTLEQINRVPPGFSNNLAWQLGHVVAVDQKYIYEKGGLPTHIEESVLAPYGNGTKPERDITQDELDTLRKNALLTVEKLKADCANGRFAGYTPHSLRHIPLNNIDDVMAMVLFHEGLHVGAAKNLRRAVLAA